MNVFVRQFVTILALLSTAEVTGGIHPRLQRVLDTLSPDEPVVAWVYFTDKGPHEALRNAIPTTVVSPRSMQRRAKVRPPESLVDYSDLPVAPGYVDALTPHVIRIRQQTKWFNGVSVLANGSQISILAGLPFVRQVELVARFARNPEEMEEFQTIDKDPPSAQPGRILSFNYGSSLNQNSQINVPAVHDLGNYGQDVVVGVFDNGFRLLAHEAFDSLESRIIATYDFVDHKVSVAPNNPGTSFGAHGVNTLSTIGGFRLGQLIGPAFGATYILARTENDSSETPIEEDNWVAAIEWADSIGVDVTSTSLGYLDYDSPHTSWTWEDMDGNSTAITRAADMAVGKGIIVVNSAGNEGFNASHNTLGAPADGDSVLSIGAVTAAGVRSSFSSVGPTTGIPPRIKPDVMAQGSTVRVASATNPTGYGTTQGTSFSCPLAAGVAALIVHARPTDSPMEIMNAMRSTASQAGAPDNLYGWGILNALAALTPSSVVQQLPANGATNQSTSPALAWTDSRWAATYRIQIALDPAFTTIVHDDSALSDTTASVSGLAAGATYHWRVNAKNLYGTSAFTSAWSFTTAAIAPSTPALISPANGAVNQPVATTLTWGSSPGAATYRVRISSDSTFAVTTSDSTVTDTTFAPALFFPGVQYFWQVRATNSGGDSPWSGVCRFTTNGFVWADVVVAEGWNILSLPVDVVDASSASLFPGAVSPAFTFTPSGYEAEDTLRAGVGYWVKFDASDSIAIGGNVRLLDSIAVMADWNLIGGISGLVDTLDIIEEPSGIRASDFYRYDNGYSPVGVLQPGGGYWVKCNQPGVLILDSAPRVWRVNVHPVK